MSKVCISNVAMPHLTEDRFFFYVPFTTRLSFSSKHVPWLATAASGATARFAAITRRQQ